LKVEYEGGSYKNIIATLPGTNTSSADVVIVGAHYDSVSSSPKAPGGADDACGDAIVLELARVISQHQFNHTVVFALWNDEEGGEKGSNAYAESAAANLEKIPLYFNFDSSCYDHEGHFIPDVMYNSQSSWAGELMTKDNTPYGINFTLTYNVHTCSADCLSFWSHGYLL
jgi:Zn-dependent M28 family amino/carboxypeptidase